MPDTPGKEAITQAEARVLEDLRAKRRARQFDRWLGWAIVAVGFALALSPGAATAALLVGSALTLWRLRADPAMHFRRLPFDIPVLIFAGFGAASILVSPDPAFSFYNYYNLVGVYLLMYFFIGQNLRTGRELKLLIASLAASALLCVLYGFYQFAFGIDTSAMKWVDGEAFPELRKRVFSTWENPNIFAGYLDVMMCLVFGVFLRVQARGQRLVLALALLAFAACLAMTYARGACLAIAAVFLAYGALRDWRVLVACVLVGGGILALDPALLERMTSVFTRLDTSSEMRLAFWESTVAMIADHPFLGIGWGAYWMVYPLYDFYMQGAAGTTIKIVHAHNMYLNYAAEIGIIGALAFFWFFFGTLVTALRTRFLTPEEIEREAQAGRAPQPTDLSPESGIDEELRAVHESIAVRTEAPAWNWEAFRVEVSHWEERRLASGFALGIGLALVSIALNGLTDDLLFNIPSSMLMWMLAATAASLSFVSKREQAATRKEQQT